MSKERFLWAASILKDYQNRQEFGEVVVRFENGRIVHIEEKKSRKPPKEKA